MFNKYNERGAGYHWDKISYHLLKRNSFILARYNNVVSLVEKNTSLKGKTVLDVGCGDGVLSYLLSKKGLTVSGVDYTSDAVEFAKEKTQGNIEFKVGNVYEIPWADNSFDVVVSSDVIEHLDDVDKYIGEIKRVLKKDGICVLSTPVRITEEPLDKEHVVEWFESEYVDVIEKYFPDSEFYTSHPVCLKELMSRTYFNKPWGKIIFNLLSISGYNAFESFESNFKYMSLQYSVSRNIK